uniref:Zinc finger protein 740b n=1 Tax=Hucho hucho TaxID=62062 RepID=A0A4W5PQW0_9TELE
MQANNMSGSQKKLTSQHGQGQRDNNNPESHQQQSHQAHHGHHNNHQAHHSHMVLPSGVSCPPLLIRKDGHSFHTPRLLDEKDMQASQNMQSTKKKHRKSGTPNKLREKVEQVEMDINGDDDHDSLVQKNFICEHCYGAFRSSYHLKRHILTHTGEKPFACDVCDMRFIQRYHLDRHKRVHSGEKPYQCDRCNQVREICTHPPELLTDGPSATSPASVWSEDQPSQGGEPVILLREQRRSLLPGCTWAHGRLEPPTAAEQPSGCLTSDPSEKPPHLTQSAVLSSVMPHTGADQYCVVPQPQPRETWLRHKTKTPNLMLFSPLSSYPVDGIVNYFLLVLF